MADTDTDESLPTYDHGEGAIQAPDEDHGTVFDPAEMTEFLQERAKDPIEVIGDTPAAVGLPRDPQAEARTRPPKVEELETATWGDLRDLPVPPPDKGSVQGLEVFACPQHPYMAVMNPSPPHTVLARFEHGYLATDDQRVIKAVRRSRYVRRVAV